MILGINKEMTKLLWEGSLEVFTFAAVGYFCGRGVNWVNKWTSIPAFFGKSDAIQAKGVSLLCGFFMTIDLIVHKTLLSLFTAQEINRPFFTAVRIVLNSYAAVCLFNVSTSILNFNKIELKKAPAIIFVACIVYSQILVYLRVFNEERS